MSGHRAGRRLLRRGRQEQLVQGLIGYDRDLSIAVRSDQRDDPAALEKTQDASADTREHDLAVVVEMPSTRERFLGRALADETNLLPFPGISDATR